MATFATWSDLQARKHIALAAYNSIVYTDPVDLKIPDPLIVADIERLKGEIESIKLDHSGMTRVEYRNAVSGKRQSIVEQKANIKPNDEANALKIKAAKVAFRTARRQARREYLNLVEEEQKTFGFTVGVVDLVNDEG
jgi:hypothetical protein